MLDIIEFLPRHSQVSDTGQYVCKATNVAGQVDKNFHLNIYGTELLGVRLIKTVLFFTQPFGFPSQCLPALMAQQKRELWKPSATQSPLRATLQESLRPVWLG